MRGKKAVLCATGLLLFSVVCVVAQPPDPLPPIVGQPIEIRPQPEPVPNPADTIYAFVFWFNAMNLRECAALVEGAQFNDALAGMELEMRKEAGQISVMIDEPRVEMTGFNRVEEVPGRMGEAPGDPVQILGGDKLRANVRTTVVTLRGRGIHRETNIDWLQLRRVGNEWKLVPDDPNMQQRRLAHGGLQEFVNFMAAPVQARTTARAASCRSNMRQLCLGMMQLTQDFDEKFDIKKMQEAQRENNQFAKWPIWVQAVMPYVKSLQLFRCPEDRNPGDGAVSYSFNENLEGVNLAQIERPADLVMLYEGKDGKLDFRHDGRATVGFADGHVKLLGEEESKNLVWKP